MSARTVKMFNSKELNDMAGFEKGKKYDVVDAEHGECVGCCFNKDGCTLDIDILCRKEFIYKEIKDVEG